MRRNSRALPFSYADLLPQNDENDSEMQCEKFSSDSDEQMSNITITNAHFDEFDPDPDWNMDCEMDSSDSEIMSSQDSHPCPVSPVKSPVKHQQLPQSSSTPTKKFPVFNFSPFKAPPEPGSYYSPRKPPSEGFYSPRKPLFADFNPCSAPVSPQKITPNLSPQKPPSEGYYSPRKPSSECGSCGSPLKEVFSPRKNRPTSPNYRSRQNEHSSVPGSYSPVKLDFIHRPFTYADLLPQEENDLPSVAIHKRTRCESTSSTDDKTLFFPVPDLIFTDLNNWAMKPPKNYDDESPSLLKAKVKTMTGHLVVVNNTNIALFRYGSDVFAINERCPHAGGPLHIGDVEVLPDMSVCVRCPWHGWTFDLLSGRTRKPLSRSQTADIYPVKVLNDGSMQIGFDHFHPSILMKEVDF